MQEIKVAINGRTLTTSETATLRMALKLGEADLQLLATDCILEGIGVAEHLKNLSVLSSLILRS